MSESYHGRTLHDDGEQAARRLAGKHTEHISGKVWVSRRRRALRKRDITLCRVISWSNAATGGLGATCTLPNGFHNEQCEARQWHACKDMHMRMYPAIDVMASV